MWTLKKIEQYITDGIEENIHLDYKGAGSISKSREKKKEISKDVSAFANSDGGVIIYGVREFDEKEKSHLPEKIDPISGQEFTKEWLEQIINSTISPRIKGIIITPIQTSEKDKNDIVYVVEIPKSNTAHQSQDKRYYRRYNFQSIMMDDWEIKDIINRQSKTNIEIEFETVINKGILNKILKSSSKIELKIWARNTGNKVVKYLDCYMSGSAETAKNINKPIINGDFEKLFSNSVEREINIDSNSFIINSERTAILPNTARMIGELTIYTDFIDNNSVLNFQISTDDNIKYFTITGKEIIE
ncbi:MAG: ATP-binding protein [Flavobacteriaceae bacterium]